MNPFWDPADPLPDVAEALSEVRRWIVKRHGVSEDTEPLLDFIDAVLAKRNDDKIRIAHLEMVINEIDGALCNYCNTVEDSDHPFHPLDEAAQKRTFKDLCDAYNLWHERHGDISDISMKFFEEHERHAMVLREIANGYYSTIERATAAAKDSFEKVGKHD